MRFSRGHIRPIDADGVRLTAVECLNFEFEYEGKKLKLCVIEYNGYYSITEPVSGGKVCPVLNEAGRSMAAPIGSTLYDQSVSTNFRKLIS